MKLDNAVLIGTGALNWDGFERRSDRYGTVTLHDLNSDDQPIAINSHLKKEVISLHIGKPGKLIAEILETRESTHIGDLFRGFFPVTPTIGDIIFLGEGTLFSQNYSWAEAIGLKPDDSRSQDWLNPESLYKCHDQTINLYFIPQT